MVRRNVIVLKRVGSRKIQGIRLKKKGLLYEPKTHFNSKAKLSKPVTYKKRKFYKVLNRKKGGASYDKDINK